MRSRSAEGNARVQRLVVVSLTAIALGSLVVVQLRSQAAAARTLAAQDDTSVALLINDLNRANNQLIQQGAALSQQEAQLREALTAGARAAPRGPKKTPTLATGHRPPHGRSHLLATPPPPTH